jgi:hypothetical protein
MWMNDELEGLLNEIPSRKGDLEALAVDPTSLPLSEYTISHFDIVAAYKINITPTWITAWVQLKNKSSGKSTAVIFRWQKVRGEWKQRSKVSLSKSNDLVRSMMILKKFIEQWEK